MYCVPFTPCHCMRVTAHCKIHRWNAEEYKICNILILKHEFVIDLSESCSLRALHQSLILQLIGLHFFNIMDVCRLLGISQKKTCIQHLCVNCKHTHWQRARLCLTVHASTHPEHTCLFRISLLSNCFAWFCLLLHTRPPRSAAKRE